MLLEGFSGPQTETTGPSSEERSEVSSYLQLTAEADNELSDLLSTGESNSLANLDATTSQSCSSSSTMASTPGHRGPLQRCQCNKPFEEASPKEYLMYPTSIKAMQCIVSGALVTSFKTSMIKRHVECHHEYSLTFSES